MKARLAHCIVVFLCVSHVLGVISSHAGSCMCNNADPCTVTACTGIALFIKDPAVEDPVAGFSVSGGFCTLSDSYFPAGVTLATPLVAGSVGNLVSGPQDGGPAALNIWAMDPSGGPIAILVQGSGTDPAEVYSDGMGGWVARAQMPDGVDPYTSGSHAAGRFDISILGGAGTVDEDDSDAFGNSTPKEKDPVRPGTPSSPPIGDAYSPTTGTPFPDLPADVIHLGTAIKSVSGMSLDYNWKPWQGKAGVASGFIIDTWPSEVTVQHTTLAVSGFSQPTNVLSLINLPGNRSISFTYSGFSSPDSGQIVATFREGTATVATHTVTYLPPVGGSDPGFSYARTLGGVTETSLFRSSAASFGGSGTWTYERPDGRTKQSGLYNAPSTVPPPSSTPGYSLLNRRAVFLQEFAKENGAWQQKMESEYVYDLIESSDGQNSGYDEFLTAVREKDVATGNVRETKYVRYWDSEFLNTGYWGALRCVINPEGRWEYYEYASDDKVDAIWTPWGASIGDPIAGRTEANSKIIRQMRSGGGGRLTNFTTEKVGGVLVAQERTTPASSYTDGNPVVRYNTRSQWLNANGSLGAWTGTVGIPGTAGLTIRSRFIETTVNGNGMRSLMNPGNSTATYSTDYIDPATFDVTAYGVDNDVIIRAQSQLSTRKTTTWPGAPQPATQVDTFETLLNQGVETVVSTTVKTSNLANTHSTVVKDGAPVSESTVTEDALGANTEVKIDSAGIKTTTVSTVDGSVVTQTKEGVAAGSGWDAQPALVERTTNLEYEGRTERVLASGGSRTLSITTRDGLGRVKQTTDEIGRVTSYTYGLDSITGGETLTELRPGGVTVKTISFRDGQTQSVVTKDENDTVIQAEYHDYVVNGTGSSYPYGSITESIHYGTPTSAVWKKSTRNALGWVVREEEPGPTGATIKREYTFNASGLVTKISATGLADYLYQYDTQLRVFREGYDLNNNGVLDVNSADTLTETTYGYQQKKMEQSGVWRWCEWKKTAIYEAIGVPPVATTVWSTIEHPEAHETLTQQSDGTLVSELVSVDPASKKISRKVKVTVPTSQNMIATHFPSESMSINGLLITENLPAQSRMLTYHYDAEGRQSQVDEAGIGATSVTRSPTTGQVLTESRPGQAVLSYAYYPSTHRNAGELASTTQIDAGTVRSAYDALGRLTHRWGSGTQPIKYIYDSARGALTQMWTFKADTIPAGVAPVEAPPTAFETASKAVTQWIYHTGTTSLWKKIDDANAFTEYQYHDSGLLRERKWARFAPGSTTAHPTATYSYQNAVASGAQKLVPGRITGITYSNDGDATPDVTFSYRRDGSMESCQDGAGGHWFTYSRPSNSAFKPLSISEVLGNSTFQAKISTSLAADGTVLWSRQESMYTFIETTHKFGTGGRYIGGKTLQNVYQGPPQEFPDERFLSHTRTYNAATGQLEGIQLRPGNWTTSNSSAPWTIGQTLGRDAAAGRITSVLYQKTVGGTSTPVMGWAYTDFDGAGRRKKVLPYDGTNTRTAGEPPAWSYTYNVRGEVIGGSRFRAEAGPTSTVASQNLGYSFDGMGNRINATRGATPAVHTTSYPNVNVLNQYTSIANPRALEISGLINNGFTASVKVNGTAQTMDGAGTGEPGSFRADVDVSSNSDAWQQVEVSATKVSTGETAVVSSGHRYTPPANEALSYDADGNLTEDGRWTYTWDAENRLIAQTEKLLSGPHPARKKLTFAYDAKYRRVAKTVHEWEGSDSAGGFTKLVTDRRFLYDGWNLTLELDHTYVTSAIIECKPVRACYWGPDVSGTLQGAGGVGGLLAICTPAEVLLPCTDANGNVKGLVTAGSTTIGGLVARYDYDPFGNRVTDTGPGVEICPFGFSTKYLDQETGLLYYIHRYYSPEIGRWLSMDPLCDAAFKLQKRSVLKKVNTKDLEMAFKTPYLFAMNDAIQKIDYLGLSALDLLIKIKTGRLKKMAGADFTGAMVVGVGGLTGSSQLAFFPDTCEIGWFDILGAADEEKPGAFNLLKDMPVGFDFSLSFNGSTAYYRGPNYASAATWTGVFYGLAISGGRLGNIGAGIFWDPNGYWIGGSVGVGVSPSKFLSLRTNPQTYYLNKTWQLNTCACNVLIGLMP